MRNLKSRNQTCNQYMESFKIAFYLLTFYGKQIKQTSKESAPSEPRNYIYSCCQLGNEHV